MTRGKLASALLASAMVALPLTAVAQDVRNVPVQDRERPEFDPLGVRAGAFLIYPSLTVGGSYDDNIFASANDEEDDYIFTIAPTVRAQSQWSRHSLTLTAGGEAAAFADNSDSNYVDYSVGASGRIDVRRETRVNLGLSLNQGHEDRSDPDEAGADDVTDVFRGRFTAGVRQGFNRIFVQPTLLVNRLDFDDVDNVNNDDRDRWNYVARLRAGYALSPRINLFGQGEYRMTRYDETPDDGGFDRDSEGLGISAGAEIDITGILFGEVSAGYTRQEYDDNDLETFDGISASGQLTWNVTPLTSIVGAVSADVTETTVTVGGDTASANYATNASIDVTHELRRNVLLNGNLGYLRNDFEGTDRTDDTFMVGLGVTYLLNRNLSLNATYRFSDRQSDVDDAEYTRNVIRLGLTAKL